MAQDDVKQALEAMDDDAIRDQLAAGDFSALPDLDLSAEERQLVQDAAGDYPDVAGFAFGTFAQGDGSVMPTDIVGQKQLVVGDIGFKFKVATDYAWKLRP